MFDDRDPRRGRSWSSFFDASDYAERQAPKRDHDETAAPHNPLLGIITLMRSSA